MEPKGRLRRMIPRGRREDAPAPAPGEEELRETSERLHRVLDTMTDAVVVVDAHKKVTLANPAAERLLGVPREDLVGSTLRKAVGSAGLDLVMSQAAAAGEAVEDEVELMWPARRTLAVQAAPLSAGGGVVAVVADVTRARQVERMRRDFVANVSHELKTPVAGIMLLAESLRDALASGDAEPAQRFAERLVTEADRLRQLSGDLLALSRVESMAPIKRDAVDLEALVRESAERLRPAAEEKGLELAVMVKEPEEPAIEGCGSYLPEPWTIEGNAEDLSVLVRNLIENAVRYTDIGSITVTLDASAEGRTLEIRDTGVGIPSKDLGRVFERFYRVEKSRARDTGGTGLGLSIVKHIADAYGLSVSLSSKEDAGTTVRVLFPDEGPPV
jgi:two-component system phosphate regulon sensor histidine kinase PhoR